jgi:pyruvate formate lyase activating enzyme
MNDSDKELRQIADFLYSINPAMPWHVTGFYPTDNMTNRPPTPVASLERARKIGLSAGLHHVYEGNRPGRGGENTFCPSCGVDLVLRHGFSIRENYLQDGACPSCGKPIHGIWK